MIHNIFIVLEVDVNKQILMDVFADSQYVITEDFSGLLTGNK
jgi:hypothetical protein